MGKTETVKIGPEMPEVPVLSDKTVTDAPVASGERQVVREERDGLIIETIVSVERPSVETREELQSRVKETYQDAHGNTIQTY